MVCQADQSRIRIRAHGPYFHLMRFCQFHGDNYLILIGRVITSASSYPHTALILAHNSDQPAPTADLERLNSGKRRFVFARIFEPYCSEPSQATRDPGI